MGMVEINRKFLQNMEHPRAPMYVQVLVTVMHVGWCYLLTDYFELGLIGCALSLTVSQAINMVILHGFTTYCLSKEVREKAWFNMFKKEFVGECFDMQGLREYFKMGVSSIGMLSLEWWCYEFMMVFSARLGVIESATQIVLANFSSLIYMFPLGL